MLLYKQQHTQRRKVYCIVYAVILHWLCGCLPKICNIFKKPWFEYMNSSINSLDLKYYEIILRCLMCQCLVFTVYDLIAKTNWKISIAAIDIKLRYCRYSTTWSSRYSHTASIILTAFSPSSWPWALPQSYGLPGKQEEIYMFPLTFFLPYLKLSAITFMFYP